MKNNKDKNNITTETMPEFFVPSIADKHKGNSIKQTKYHRRLKYAAVLTVILTVMSVCLPSHTGSAYAAGISTSVYIDGKSMEGSTVMSGGSPLVSLKALSDSMKFNTRLDSYNRSVDITKGEVSARIWIDNRLYSYTSNGSVKYGVCKVPPAIINGSTYIPVDLICSILGVPAEWNSSASSVSVNTSKSVSPAPFFNIKIQGLTEGQTVADAVKLSLIGAEQYASSGYQIRYLFLNPVTGTGKIVAATSDFKAPVQWVPDMAMNSSGILAAVVCDNSGNTVSGAAIPVTLALSPRVALAGLAQGTVLSDSIGLSSYINFMADGVIYEISYADGTSDRTALSDPQGTYTFTPPRGKNGAATIYAIAVNGTSEYKSAGVGVTINMPAVSTEPYVNLKAIDTANIGKIPVTLSIARNFDVNTTQYWARNISTNSTVLLNEKPWGDYSWFPGPDMAGTWEIYVKVVTPAGKVYTSNGRTVTVPSQSSLILGGIGPDQVITGAVSLSSKCNTAVQQISYIITNPNNGTQAVIGTSASPDTPVEWTPSSVNAGNRKIHASAVTKDGRTITSEPVSVTVYLGTIYSSKPIVAKDKFIEYIKPMALQTQKETGMSAALQISQAILETGWGQSLPVDKYSGQMSYNLFGVKGTGTKGSVICNTWEEYYGTVYRIDDYFRAYNNASESWNDHNALLLTRERYIPYTKVMHNSTWGAYALRRCGYATDSAYPGKLINIIDLYELDSLDNQGL